MLISIVSPVYKAEEILDQLILRITNSVNTITGEYEIVLVEDGGNDRSWDIIEKYCKKDNHIKGIKLSRNFGQHYAITAGLDICRGEWAVVMDCDLQDQPEEILKLYSEALKGYDIVYAKRKQRHDGVLKKLFSNLFYKIFAWLSGVSQDGSIANFGIYSRKAINAVNSLREPMRSFATMIKWVGFKSTAINVEHAERFAGRSTYNFKKLLRLALDISLAYSDKPLRLTVKVGVIISSSAFLVGLFTLYRYFIGKITEPGFTSLIVSIWFLSGLIILTLGVIGLYVSKIFEGIKQRPLYIIEKIIGNEE
ncbi:MAG: glycosyltransferase [Bacteroidetes bacterium]|nr:glycosyltransferase [Bacteroidota bacterium]MBS1926205.1 glycosyltransferase [Bacteroidota bacterium]